MNENILPEVQEWVQKGLPTNEIPFIHVLSAMDIESLVIDFIFLVFFIWLGYKIVIITQYILRIEGKINILLKCCKNYKLDDPFSELK